MGEPTAQKIEDENLHMILPIQKLNPPEASSIIAFHQGLGPGRDYKLQVNLKTRPEDAWVPMLKLGDEIMMNGISVSRPDDQRFAPSFSLESDNSETIRQWSKLLGELMNIPDAKIVIDLTPVDESGSVTPPSAAE